LVVDMSKEAMKLALEALNNATSYGSLTGADWVFKQVDEAIKALEEALAKQEQGELVAMAQVYRCKIKSRKKIDREIPREKQGWWADISAGQLIRLREATQADVDRCTLNGAHSKDPADYMCETHTNGSLVSKVALEYMNPEQNVFASTTPQPKQEQGEPVAVMELHKSGWDLVEDIDTDWLETLPFGTKLYTRPQPKQEQRSVRAIADSEQLGEPVAYMYPDDLERMQTSESFCTVFSVKVGSPDKGLSTVELYTTPQQRTWVGLTEEELRQIWYDDAPVEGGTYVDKLRQVEAKLKEKNT
jgi:PIN domain nuclease of toxin-antitoxin system